jgi:uncharacterized linocin/CFP29 family protein
MNSLHRELAGDFGVDIGEDISIGRSSHSSAVLELHFLETFTFRVPTAEAAVVLDAAREEA